MSQLHTVSSSQPRTMNHARGDIVDSRFQDDALGSSQMTFVNELISDEDKKKIDWSLFRTYSFSKPHRPWKWTIDREHNAFFIHLEQVGYDDTRTRPEVYALWWRGNVIRVEAHISGSGSGKFWDTVSWKIHKVDIPSVLASERKEVVNVLTEAIRAHGELYDAEHVKRVNVEIAEGTQP